MKIAWIIGTNITAEDFDSTDSVKNSGGWNNTQLKKISESDRVRELIIISVRPEKTDHFSESFGKVKIYHLPYNPVTSRINYNLIEDIWRIMENEDPDLVDIQGTETTYSAITYLKPIKCPVLVTLHGIAYQCERFYTHGLPAKSLIYDRTIADNLALKGVIEKKLLMRSRADIEHKILKSVKYIRGRTAWDRACVLSIHPDLQYYYEELILRDAFSRSSWDISKCQPHRIFTSQANSPIKTLYTLLEAIAILKRKYNDVKLVVPGHPIRTGLIKSGHDKLIEKRIKRLGIENNIEFTGNLTADQMADELMKARVFVLQSVIENSPNSLAEAQMVGTPCVSSFTGGTPEYVRHGETGFLYNSFDPVMAAMYIEKIFTDDDLCVRMSSAEKRAAKERHDENRITQSLLDLYQSLINGENC